MWNAGGQTSERGGLPTVVGFSCFSRDFACPPRPPSVWGSLFFGPHGNGCLGYCSAREERADCATGRPIPPSVAIRGPSLPPPTSRQGRVGFRGFGSDLRVVTRTHRGSPLLSPQRGSQDRVHSRAEAVGILGHPSLCPDGGTWAPAGKRQSLSIVGNHSTHPELGTSGCLTQGLFHWV